MSFKDLDIKLSYISYGESGIAKSFLVPALKKTKTYFQTKIKKNNSSKN